MKQLQRKKHRVLILAVILTITTVFSACGGERAAEIKPLNLDVRATAADTFGSSALNNINEDADEVENAAQMDPGVTILPLDEFWQAFIDAKAVYTGRLVSALGQAGLQDSYENEIIRLDPLDLIEHWYAPAAYFGEGAEAIEIALEEMFDTDEADWDWEVDFAEEAPYFELLVYRNDVPMYYYYGFWQEEYQYLWCYYEDATVHIELDVIRTENGYAAQFYDPIGEAVFRFAFLDDGSWDSSIGVSFEYEEQPPLLTGEETTAFATEWTDVPRDGLATWLLIDGNEFTVTQGERSQETYDIDTNGTQSPQSAGSQNPQLSAEAAKYIGMWHGSPGVGSGYSERFALYDNGVFVWGANEMDGAMAIRYLAGTWDVSSGELILDATVAIVLEGGELVDNDGTLGSYASDQVIVGATLAGYNIEQQFVMNIGEIKYDRTEKTNTTTINTLKVWDISAQGDSMVDGFWQLLSTQRAKDAAAGSPDRSTPSGSGLR
ncbi:MAG: hypothetical protein LBN36_01410 [Clostridiales Family XIII bacterium]|nr:hypothetical protein [Clostridiales Family XIII bacterium]